MATDPIKARIELVRLRSQAAMFVALSLAACSSPGGDPPSVGATLIHSDGRTSVFGESID